MQYALAGVFFSLTVVFRPTARVRKASAALEWVSWRGVSLNSPDCLFVEAR